MASIPHQFLQAEIVRLLHPPEGQKPDYEAFARLLEDNYAAAAPAAHELTGARNNPEAALANLIRLLAQQGLLTDSTTAV